MQPFPQRGEQLGSDAIRFHQAEQKSMHNSLFTPGGSLGNMGARGGGGNRIWGADGLEVGKKRWNENHLMMHRFSSSIHVYSPSTPPLLQWKSREGEKKKQPVMASFSPVTAGWFTTCLLSIGIAWNPSVFWASCNSKVIIHKMLMHCIINV